MLNQYQPIDFDHNYIDAMIDASPCEYYARICAFVGA